MTELLLPQHSNVLGTAFGGTVLAWMDVCGAVSAQRHSGRVSVTASMDDVNFVSPIRIGDVVILTGRVNAAFRTSVEVEVQVQVEDRPSGARRRCVEAFMTFVAVDEGGKPCEQPPLALETADDERRSNDARARRDARLAKRK